MSISMMLYPVHSCLLKNYWYFCVTYYFFSRFINNIEYRATHCIFCFFFESSQLLSTSNWHDGVTYFVGVALPSLLIFIELYMFRMPTFDLPSQYSLMLEQCVVACIWSSQSGTKKTHKLTVWTISIYTTIRLCILSNCSEARTYKIKWRFKLRKNSLLNQYGLIRT